jgi:hypothetical protein
MNYPCKSVQYNKLEKQLTAIKEFQPKDNTAVTFGLYDYKNASQPLWFSDLLVSKVQPDMKFVKDKEERKLLTE